MGSIVTLINLHLDITNLIIGPITRWLLCPKVSKSICIQVFKTLEKKICLLLSLDGTYIPNSPLLIVSKIGLKTLENIIFFLFEFLK